MNYHPDDFLSLIEEAEDQGGVHLSEVCKPGHFRANQPIDPDNPQGPKVNKRLETSGCHRRAKFLVPLLPDMYFMDDCYLGDDVGITDVDRDGTITTRRARAEDFDFDDEKNPLSRMGDGSPALVKVCAVDDAMGLWPRYQSAMLTGESFELPLGEE